MARRLELELEPEMELELGLKAAQEGRLRGFQLRRWSCGSREARRR